MPSVHGARRVCRPQANPAEPRLAGEAGAGLPSARRSHMGGADVELPEGAAVSPAGVSGTCMLPAWRCPRLTCLPRRG